MKSGARGFTLVELIVTLSLLAIVAVIGSQMIATVSNSQRSGVDRLAAAGAADGALRRVAREVQGSLPNSLRVTRNGSAVFIEFVPVQDGGRFRAAIDATGAGPGDPLDLDDPLDNRFDVLGPPVAAAAGSQLVIHNLGTDLADAYSGNNRRAVTSLPSSGSQVAFTPNGAFPASTDSHRFFLVGTPVSFVCEPVTLASGAAGFRLQRLAGYGWQATQPADLGAAPLASATRALLLDGLGECDASYSQALANIGLLMARVGVAGENGASLPLLAQLAVDNTP